MLEDLDGRIDGVLDGGATGVGLESTVVRVVDGTIYILRPGGVTREQLREAGGGLAVVAEETKEADRRTGAADAGGREGTGAPGSLIIGANAARLTGTEANAARPAGTEADAAYPVGTEAPRSPGVKYTHYAPRGEMLLVNGEGAPLRAAVRKLASQAADAGRRVAVLSCSEHAAGYTADAVFDCGPRGEPEKAAQTLYAALRECDEKGVDYIVAEGYSEDGIGAALMNRLRKAAGGREIFVP